MADIQKWKANWTNGTRHDWSTVTYMVSIRVPQIRPCVCRFVPFHCNTLMRWQLQDKSTVLPQCYINVDMKIKAGFCFQAEHFANCHKEICFNTLIRPTYKSKGS